MSRFNTITARSWPHSAVTSETAPSGQTYEGAPGYARDARSELFLLAVAHMGDGSFYESTPERDQRFCALVHGVTMNDLPWMQGFIPWLRGEANMRTASVVAAAEAAKALLIDEKPGGRGLIASALQRADEPGELLAYWHSRYGRAVPKPVKRGLADAIQRLYTERAFLRYDSGAHGYRFGDVIDLVHPSPAADRAWQGTLFQWAITARHGRDEVPPETLPTVRARWQYGRMPADERHDRARQAFDGHETTRAELARATAGQWEWLLSWLGEAPRERALHKADQWRLVLPDLGYMALLRNLRNFDEAGLPDGAADAVIQRLADPAQVAKSRQFPFRFLSAYRAAPSLRWAYPLEKALNASLANVPALPGRTLVLVDRSLSMWGQKLSDHSTVDWADGAAIFGVAVASRAQHADLVEFSSRPAPVTFSRAESVLKIVERFHRGDDRNGVIGTGTDIPRAVREHLRPDHTRVVIVTDEQSEPGILPSNVYGYYGDAAAMPPTRIDDLIPRSVPVYVWNFGGYKHGAVPSGGQNRHTFGGLSDAAFRMIPALEAGRDAKWPWLQDAAD